MRPLRALIIACFLGFFAIGASCDDGSKDDETVETGETGSAGDEERIEVAELDVPALDKMGEGDRERLGDLINDLLSPCGEPISLARCVKEGTGCEACEPAVGYVARLVAEGYASGDIESRYHNRYDEGAEVDLEVAGSPVRGSPMAPITLVEFSDFECPFCGAAHPILERIVNESNGEVRLVFKHFPLPSHPHAEQAARAAIAAGKQGKFWEMHDLLFENQDGLEPSDLEDYARELDLDVDQFAKDMKSEAAAERIAKDQAMGREAGVKGTPTIFVDGRLYDEPLRSLPAYIEEVSK